MNKLKAFTVLEVLITMGVMSIIIGLTYYLYNSFSQQTFFFQKNTEASQNFEKFTTLLKRDFFDAESILKTENGFEITFYEGKKNIKYLTDKQQLIRIQNNQKTSLTYQNIDFKVLENNQNLVTKLLVEGILFNEVISLKFQKKYPPNFSIAFQ